MARRSLTRYASDIHTSAEDRPNAIVPRRPRARPGSLELVAGVGGRGGTRGPLTLDPTPAPAPSPKTAGKPRGESRAYSRTHCSHLKALRRESSRVPGAGPSVGASALGRSRLGRRQSTAIRLTARCTPSQNSSAGAASPGGSWVRAWTIDPSPLTWACHGRGL